ncbi:MAG: hypothetical protein IJS26_03550 [Alphaproteobacteria bacterium]|nr:hypothetical protein [Alphaproteobacteria bacterium]
MLSKTERKKYSKQLRKDISCKLIELRQKTGLSRAEFCAKYGVEKGTLLTFETKFHRSGLDLLSYILSFYDKRIQIEFVEAKTKEK